ncbi:RNA polymerase sigma-70 factor [Puia sp. P3]|uniref:RNA polymerase sigma-70 factor n=1 Tax=Puia sp. P3 TaxID=3423952 RepID=UPI003D665305
MKKTKSGDLYNEKTGRLLNFLQGSLQVLSAGGLQIPRRRPLAQEVVNDVFVRLWQDAEKIDIQSSLKSYLYRAVVNRCLNELDKNKRDRQHFQELKHRPEETAEWKEMEDNELKIRLYKAIDDLLEQCRKVFRMSRFEELKQQEIADRLGISIKTVKNHITHALQQLNRVLDEWNTLPMLLAMAKYFLDTTRSRQSFFVLYLKLWILSLPIHMMISPGN